MSNLLRCYRVSNSVTYFQYAPSFSLSAPCILLTLTRRLRVISNAYFDTPSLPKEPKCLLRPYPYSPLQWDLFFNAFSINGSF